MSEPKPLGIGDPRTLDQGQQRRSPASIVMGNLALVPEVIGVQPFEARTIRPFMPNVTAFVQPADIVFPPMTFSIQAVETRDEKKAVEHAVLQANQVEEVYKNLFFGNKRWVVIDTSQSPAEQADTFKRAYDVYADGEGDTNSKIDPEEKERRLLKVVPILKSNGAIEEMERLARGESTKLDIIHPDFRFRVTSLHGTFSHEVFAQVFPNYDDLFGKHLALQIRHNLASNDTGRALTRHRVIFLNAALREELIQNDFESQLMRIRDRMRSK